MSSDLVYRGAENQEEIRVIKAMATGPDGKKLLVLGLSFGNLDKFREAPGDTYIRMKRYAGRPAG